MWPAVLVDLLAYWSLLYVSSHCTLAGRCEMAAVIQSLTKSCSLMQFTQVWLKIWAIESASAVCNLWEHVWYCSWILSRCRQKLWVGCWEWLPPSSRTRAIWSVSIRKCFPTHYEVGEILVSLCCCEGLVLSLGILLFCLCHWARGKCYRFPGVRSCLDCDLLRQPEDLSSESFCEALEVVVITPLDYCSGDRQLCSSDDSKLKIELPILRNISPGAALLPSQ